jgi:hypothetical protein
VSRMIEINYKVLHPFLDFYVSDNGFTTTFCGSSPHM